MEKHARSWNRHIFTVSAAIKIGSPRDSSVGYLRYSTRYTVLYDDVNMTAITATDDWNTIERLHRVWWMKLNAQSANCRRRCVCVPRAVSLSTLTKWPLSLSVHYSSDFWPENVQVSRWTMAVLKTSDKNVFITCRNLVVRNGAVWFNDSTRHLWDTCFFCSRTNSLEFTARLSAGSSCRLRTI